VVNRAGRDPADRLLALAVALLPAARQEWGRAMRAEQAHIGSGQDRWRFAVGCLRVALWQGPLWRVAGSLAAQAGAIFVTVASGLTGSFAVEVVGLVLVLPPASWWLGRRTGYFGQSGVPRAARIGLMRRGNRLRRRGRRCGRDRPAHQPARQSIDRSRACATSVAHRSTSARRQ